MNNKEDKGTMGKQKWILWDIDGTVVTATPGWAPERTMAWNDETLDAGPIEGAVCLVIAFSLMGYKNIFLTARDVTCKKNTVKKLKEIGVWPYVDALYHRPMRYSGIASHKYKHTMYTMLKKTFNITHAIDDEDKNLAMFADQGLCVINANVFTTNNEGGE